MSNRFTSQYGELQGGIMFEQMAHQYGLNTFFATHESRTKEAMAADEERAKKEADAHAKRTQKFTGLVKSVSIIEAASQSSVGLLGAIAIKLGTNFMGGVDSKYVTGIEDFVSKGAGMGNTKLSDFIAGITETHQNKLNAQIKEKKEAMELQKKGLSRQQLKMDFYGTRLAMVNDRYQQRVSEVGDIPKVKGTEQYLKLEKLKKIEKKYERERDDVLKKMSETLEKINEQQKDVQILQEEANNLQKKANKSAKGTEDNTAVSADDVKEKKNKEQDWRKMYQLKITRVSSSPTN
jgi:hypothetical protein